MSETTAQSPREPAEHDLSAIGEKIQACMQCGTCTGSCVSSHAMDVTPRALWRLVQLGLKEEIFSSRTFWLCASCYSCTLRCPRGLPLTETMAALKRIAVAEGYLKDKKSPLFYETFLKIVQRYGRVREAELMSRFFIALKDPIVPFGFLSLGAKLMAKGKLSVEMPILSGKGKLDAIYKKVQELEAGE